MSDIKIKTSEAAPMEYNTRRSHITLREYGRNIHNIVKHICTLPSKEERTKQAHTLIHLIKQLNPSVKESMNENPQRIWDHIYIMSDFQLDIDCEYPMPDRSILTKRPERIPYGSKQPRFRHYGNNLDLMVAKALAIEDPIEQRDAFIHLGRMLKYFYSQWSRENMDGDTIVEQVKLISKGKIDLSGIYKEYSNIFDTQYQPHSNNIREQGNHQHFQKDKNKQQPQRYYKKNKKKR